jgi:hypothetical protein
MVVVVLWSDASDMSSSMSMSSSSSSSSDEMRVVLAIERRVAVEAFEARDRGAAGSSAAALDVDAAVVFDTGLGGLNGRRRFAAGGIFVG